jgi:hypothetical protein
VPLLRLAAKESKNEALLKLIALVKTLIISKLILTANKRDKILAWLSPDDYYARHSTIGDAHCEQTGAWLLEDLQA